MNNELTYHQRIMQHLKQGPNILPSECHDYAPRLWMFVDDEVPQPQNKNWSNRHVADLLFLDQSGVVTLAEIKRSAETKARRSVIGQIIDYVTKAKYWTAASIRQQFENRCKDADKDPDDMLNLYLLVRDVESFWDTVQFNLDNHRLRVFFISDKIEPELVDIIETLNQNFFSIEMIALEAVEEKRKGKFELDVSIVSSTEPAFNYYQTLSRMKQSPKWQPCIWNGKFYESIRLAARDNRHQYSYMYAWIKTYGYTCDGDVPEEHQYPGSVAFHMRD